MKSINNPENISNMRHYIVLLMLLLPQAGCATSLEVYKQEAEAFCKLHNPDEWKSRAGYSDTENFDYLNAKIRRTIKSKIFLEIFNRLVKQGYVGFYDAIRPEISTLIGQEWHCKEAKLFYTISWERVGVDKGRTEVEVTVLASGVFQIKKSKYKLSDNQGISRAIQTISKGKSYKILLKVPEGTTAEKLNKYFEPLRYMGVKSLVVIYY